LKTSKEKLDLAMARACMTPAQLSQAANMPRSTLNNVIRGSGARPATIGRISKALGCDPADIIEEVSP